MSDTPEFDRLNGAAEAWRTVVGGLPPTVGVSGGVADTQQITTNLNLVADLVRQVEIGPVDQLMKLIHWQGVVGQVNSIVPSINAVVVNPTAQMLNQQAQTIVNAIWSLRSSLSWLVAPSSGGEVIKTAPSVNELRVSADAVFEMRNRVGHIKSEIEGYLNEVVNHVGQVRAALTEIEGMERTASNARANAESSDVSAKTVAQSLESLLGVLEARSSDQGELLAEFQRKKDLVDQTLEGASKVALANSFQLRRKALSAERWGWVAGFALGIVSLIIGGSYLVPRVLSGVSDGGRSIYVDIAAHILILGPLVWITWFSARKAGQTMRLAEDYAFKESAAHSFVGYKREMGDDVEMLQQLRHYAVKNFGADPLRVLADDEAASPLHDVINKVLAKVDKLKPDEAMRVAGDIAKALGQIGKG